MVVLGVFIIAVAIEVGLVFRHEDAFQGRELADLLGAEVGGFVENQAVAVAEDVCREPSVQTQAAGADDGGET